MGIDHGCRNHCQCDAGRRLALGSTHGCSLPDPARQPGLSTWAPPTLQRTTPLLVTRKHRDTRLHMPRPLLWQAASCPHSPPPPPPQQNCDRHRAWGAGRHSPTPWCTEVPRDTVGTWESCAPRDKLAGRGPHTPSLLSALLPTRRSHAHGVGTQGVRARLVLLEVTSRVRQATQSQHCHVQEMNSTLPQPPCLGALCFSSSPSPPAHSLPGSAMLSTGLPTGPRPHPPLNPSQGPERPWGPP